MEVKKLGKGVEKSVFELDILEELLISKHSWILLKRGKPSQNDSSMAFFYCFLENSATYVLAFL